MIYVDADFKKSRKNQPYPDQNRYEDNSLIQIKNANISGAEDWGDEDCPKYVSDVESCEILIDASIAKDFEGVQYISFLRYNYFHPAYRIKNTGKDVTMTKNADGSLTYTVKEAA